MNPAAESNQAGTRRGCFRLLDWVPALVWMGLMFMASTDRLSGQNTSRFLRSLIDRLFGELSEETFRWIQWGIRKGAHVAEYALLAWLLWRAFRSIFPPPKEGGWNGTAAGAAWLGAALFALTDEWHQSFTRSRVASWGDILFDVAGATLGLALVYWVQRRFKTK